MVIDMRYATTAFLALLLVMALAAPAFAADMSDLTGQDFGEHHSLMAQMVGFDGDHNPGVHHEGHDHDSHGH